MMAVTEDFCRYVLEQLDDLGQVRSRRMFGALGLYCDGAFFGLVSSDVLYFRVGDSNRGDYEARGMSRFRPYPDRPHLSMNYYEVPAEVLEDAEECILWARRSVDIARSSPKGR
jgi:DNA transformation protein